MLIFGRNGRPEDLHYAGDVKHKNKRFDPLEIFLTNKLRDKRFDKPVKRMPHLNTALRAGAGKPDAEDSDSVWDLINVSESEFQRCLQERQEKLKREAQMFIPKNNPLRQNPPPELFNLKSGPQAAYNPINDASGDNGKQNEHHRYYNIPINKNNDKNRGRSSRAGRRVQGSRGRQEGPIEANLYGYGSGSDLNFVKPNHMKFEPRVYEESGGGSRAKARSKDHQIFDGGGSAEGKNHVKKTSAQDAYTGNAIEEQIRRAAAGAPTIRKKNPLIRTRGRFLIKDPKSGNGSNQSPGRVHRARVGQRGYSPVSRSIEVNRKAAGDARRGSHSIESGRLGKKVFTLKHNQGSFNIFKGGEFEKEAAKVEIGLFDHQGNYRIPVKGHKKRRVNPSGGEFPLRVRNDLFAGKASKNNQSPEMRYYRRGEGQQVAKNGGVSPIVGGAAPVLNLSPSSPNRDKNSGLGGVGGLDVDHIKLQNNPYLDLENGGKQRRGGSQKSLSPQNPYLPRQQLGKDVLSGGFEINIDRTRPGRNHLPGVNNNRGEEGKAISPENLRKLEQRDQRLLERTKNFNQIQSKETKTNQNSTKALPPQSPARRKPPKNLNLKDYEGQEEAFLENYLTAKPPKDQPIPPTLATKAETIPSTIEHKLRQNPIGLIKEIQNSKQRLKSRRNPINLPN